MILSSDELCSWYTPPQGRVPYRRVYRPLRPGRPDHHSSQAQHVHRGTAKQVRRQKERQEHCQSSSEKWRV